MATKKINMLTGIVLPIATVVVTLVLFLLFKPAEATALFWFNMCYTIFLEAVFFGWLAFMRHDVDGVSPWLGVVLGTFGLYYCLAGIVIMVGYSILTAGCGLEIGFRWYAALLLIITLLWCIPAFFIAETDSNHELRQRDLENNTQDVRNLVADLNEMADKHATEATRLQWNRLIREANSIPPKQLSANYEKLMHRAQELINISQQTQTI